jgi:hypothetical protein
MDGGGTSSLSARLGQNRVPKGAMAEAWASSSLSYGAQNSTRFDPTQSRRQGGLIFQTYHGGNGPREASDGEAVRVAFNSSGHDVQQRSGSNDFSGGGVGRGSSSKRQIGTGGSGEVAGWR